MFLIGDTNSNDSQVARIKRALLELAYDSPNPFTIATDKQSASISVPPPKYLWHRILY